MITSINPFTQQQIFEVAELSPTQIDSAIKKSNESFQEWRNRSFEERATLLACFKIPTFPAIKAGAAKRNTCQKG